MAVPLLANALAPAVVSAALKYFFLPLIRRRRTQGQVRGAYLASHQVQDQAKCRCSLSEKRPEAVDLPFPLLANSRQPPPPHFPPLMIIRHIRGTPSLWLLLLLISAASSQPDPDCHLSIGDDRYDFSALQGDRTVSRSRSLPPTNMTDTLRFNICKGLSPLEGVGSGDQVRISNIPKAPLLMIYAV